MKRPPAGLMPHWLWRRKCDSSPLSQFAKDEIRTSELYAAILGHAAAGVRAPVEWWAELNATVRRQVRYADL